MSYTIATRTRAWAVSAVMIGLWELYRLYPAASIFLRNMLAVDPLGTVNTVLFFAFSIALAVGGIALILQKLWGRKALKFAAVAGALTILLSYLEMFLVRLDPHAAKYASSMEAGWPLEVRRQYAAVMLFSLWRTVIFNLARLVYFVLLFRHMAITSVEPGDDGVVSEAKDSTPNSMHAIRLPWAVSALLIGCLYIYSLTSVSPITTIIYQHYRKLANLGGIKLDLLTRYDLLRYVLHMPSHGFSGSLQISLILFAVIYLADAIMGTALIISSIGVIKQKAWGPTILRVVCVAGIIVDALWLILPQSLAHNSELVNAYARIPSQLQRILWGYAAATHWNTMLSHGLWMIYFALLFRRMRTKDDEHSIEGDNTLVVA